MQRKRNNLDTAEANFLYAHVLIELNKYDKFRNLSILERNNIIDDICLKCIDIANKDEDTKEALKLEIKSYKLSEEEKKNFYNESVYENSLPKPVNFTAVMKNKYEDVIKRSVKENVMVN